MKTFLVLALIVVTATADTEPLNPSRSTSEQQWQPEQPQKPSPQPQQPSFPEQQQFPQPQEQPIPQEQLNPCRDVLLQQCKPVSAMSFLWSQVVQQSSCLVMWEQCCQQLKEIPKQSRCEAIHSVVHAIILQQKKSVEGTSSQPQQQQQECQGSIQPQQHQGHGSRQPQQEQGQGSSKPHQQQLGQGMLFQPQQQLDEGSIEAIGTWVIQTLPVMCDMHVPPYCHTTISSSSDATTGMSGY